MGKQLSKIVIGNVTYDLKDKLSRDLLKKLLGVATDAALEAKLATLEALGTAAFKTYQSTWNSENTAEIPSVGAVKSYVDSQIETIPTFDVVIDAAGTEEGPSVTPSAATFHKIYLVAAGAVSGSYVEWLTIRSGTAPNYQYAWEKIGSTEIDLSNYVRKETEIAGLEIGEGIPRDDLREALDLHAFAYADEGSAWVQGEDIDGITATGNLEGEVSVTLGHTEVAANVTKGDYTPAGSITGEAIKGGSISVTIGDVATDSFADIDYKDYTPTGDVTVQLNNNTVKEITGLGTLPSKDTDQWTANVPTALDLTKFDGGEAATWSGYSYTKPTYEHTGFEGGSFTKGAAITAASEGIVVKEYVEEDEMLVFEAAAPTVSLMAHAASFTPATYGTDTFTQGDVDFGTFDGGEAASLGTGFYTAGTAANFVEGTFNPGELPTSAEKTVGVESAVFEGDKVTDVAVDGVAYKKQEVKTQEFTPVAATLGFSGTLAEDLIVTDVKYDRANDAQSGTATIEDASLDVGTISVNGQNITVYPSMPE